MRRFTKLLCCLGVLAAALGPADAAFALGGGTSCTPTDEVCDGADNDCDGVVDNGVTNACGTCGAVPTEVCDGVDNDCDGVIDDGVSNACGTCGAVPAEVCDGVDNDCDGVIDDGVSNACGTCGAVPAERCNGVDDDCDGSIDNGIDCTGYQPVVDLDVGSSHACAVREDSLWCWHVGSPVPVVAAPEIANADGYLSNVEEVSVGGFSTLKSVCALLADGRVACFGIDVTGRLGSPSQDTAVLVPGIGGVGVLEGVAQVSAGSNFACATLVDSTAVCWGQNDNPLVSDGATGDYHGQLGNGTADDSAYPQPVVGIDGVGTLTGVVQVVGGMNHSCALLSDGRVACFGLRVALGGAGVETQCVATAQQCTGFWPFRTCQTVCTQYGEVALYNESLVPRLVHAGEGPSDASGFLTNVVSLSTNTNRLGTCAVLTDGSAVCWDGSEPYAMPLSTTVATIALGGWESQTSSGYEHWCALETSGQVTCTGDNYRQQGGRAPTVENTWPTVDGVRIYDADGVSWLSDVIELGAGDEFNCALRNGEVLCWGAGEQLGQVDSSGDSAIPLPVLFE